LSVFVVGLAILLPGGSRSAPSITDIRTTSDDVPATTDNLVTVPLPTAEPSVHLPGVVNIGPVIGKASASAPSSSEAVTASSDGGASMSVIDGTTTTPQPGTCSGMSLSKDSSDNGMQSHTRMRNDHCPDGSENSDSNCDSSCND